MSDPIEESVIMELVSDELMRCRACNVTAPNQPTWESHKKGKRHQKLMQKAIEEKRRESGCAPAEEVKEEKKEEQSPSSTLVGMKSDDPILAFISGMEDMKPKVSEKYLKRQMKRREKEREQDEKNRITIETQNRERDKETNQINAQVEDLGLHVKPMAADGNCLYRSIAEQLSLDDPSMARATAYRVVRRRAANYMRQHKDEFCCFLEDDIDFDDFCSKVESSNEWGGQIELRAISMAFNRPVYVYSADSPVVIMGEDISSTPLRISFHKKYLSLGNHYNSLVPNC